MSDCHVVGCKPWRLYANYQKGLTLLELVIATALLALLSVVGWQVFSTVHKNYVHIATKQQKLSALSEAYAVLSEDMRAVVPRSKAYVRTVHHKKTDTAKHLDGTDGGIKNELANDATDNTGDVMWHDQTRLAVHEENGVLIRLLRFAPPDPSVYAQPALLQVSYHLEQGMLVRKQYDVMAQSVVASSVLLRDVSNVAVQSLRQEDEVVGFEMAFNHQDTTLAWVLSVPMLGRAE